MICGQPIAIFAQDFTVAGGSLGFMHARKITKIMDYALNMRIPLDRDQRLGRSPHSGRGQRAGGLRRDFLPQHAFERRDPSDFGDFGSLRRRGRLFSRLDRLRVRRREHIENVHYGTRGHQDRARRGDLDGGAGRCRVHSEMTGNAHFFAQSEDECFVQIRKLISMIPMNNTTKAEKIAPRLRCLSTTSRRSFRAIRPCPTTCAT